MSPGLNRSVLQKTVNPSSQRTDAYLQISTAEPDPALFRVPEGWKIVDAATAESMSTGNSYHTAAGYQYTLRVTPPVRAEFRVIGEPHSAERVERYVSNLAVANGIPPRVFPPTKLYRDPYGRSRVETSRVGLQPEDKLNPPVFPEIDVAHCECIRQAGTVLSCDSNGAVLKSRRQGMRNKLQKS